MEEIDFAEKAMDKLLEELKEAPPVLFTEQDARIQVVDRVFLEVLRYPRNELATEQQAGTKFLDYKFGLNGLARVVVEAKRDGRSLGLEHRQSGRAYLLRGSVFDTEAAQEGIEQAIKYCGRKNVELACVTNGREWIIFRGSRLGDGKDSDDGMAFAFSSLDEVRANFKIFYDLISPESVNAVRYRAIILEAEGQPVRPSQFNRPLRHPSTANLLEASPLDADLDKVMTSFFQRLSGDDDKGFLRECFVTSPESESADKRLVRIADDLIARIRPLNTSNAQQLTSLVERAISAQRNEFILIVGLKGAGKSTFIDRFFTLIIPGSVLDQCVVAKVDLATASGNESEVASWLDGQLVEITERAIFGEDYPSDDDLQGMYYDEYQRRRKGTGKHLYNTNKTQFKIDFGAYIERRRNEKPHDYLKRMIRHAVTGRKRLPCIVFDNADHFSIEFQERVFQYARSIFEAELCLMIVPITDKTSWHLSQQGAIQSFDSETLFLPVPEPSDVISTRLAYLEGKIKDEKRVSGGNYFFGRGIRLDIDNLNNFVGALQKVFIKTGPTADAVEYLSNRDVRRCLEIARDIVASGHLRADQLLRSFVSGEVNIDPHRIIRAMIKKRYDIYVGPQHKYVHNLFDMSGRLMTTHLLPLRILRMLRDMQKNQIDLSLAYVPIDQVVDYFSAMTIDRRAIESTLSEMLHKGLIWDYDPTVTKLEVATRVEISPAGFQHLLFGTHDWVYVEAMAQVTPIREEGVHLALRDRHADQFVDTQSRFIFANYLIVEDERYVICPDHVSYQSQSTVVTEFSRGMGLPMSK